MLGRLRYSSKLEAEADLRPRGVCTESNMHSAESASDHRDSLNNERARRLRVAIHGKTTRSRHRMMEPPADYLL